MRELQLDSRQRLEMTKHLVLFDIDGTLLRARGAGRIAFEKAFQELHGIGQAWGELNPHGRTDRDIIEEVCRVVLDRQLSTEESHALEQRFVQYFDEIIWEHPNFELMPGVEALVSHLSSTPEIVLGIETGNLLETAALKLRRGAIDHFFTFGGYGSDSRERSEIVRIAIERAKALYRITPDTQITVFGDSVNDITAAHDNGARAIAVATGGIGIEHFKEKTSADLALVDLSNLEDLATFFQ